MKNETTYCILSNAIEQDNTIRPLGVIGVLEPFGKQIGLAPTFSRGLESRDIVGAKSFKALE